MVSQQCILAFFFKLCYVGFYDPKFNQPCWIILVNFLRIYILVLMNEMVYNIHFIQTIAYVVEFSSVVSLLFLFVLSCLVDLLIWDSRILISITIVLDLFFFFCTSFCFTHSHFLWLLAYSVIDYCDILVCFVPFVIVCFLVNFFFLKF